MKAIILAGGRGTRLGLSDLPKPMVSVAGQPLLEHQVILLKRYGIREIIMLTGYLSEKIESYFGDGSQWGMKISYMVEREALGTSGALKQLEGKLTDRFLVLYGDVMMDFNIHRFIEFDRQKSSLGSIIAHPNDHPYDSDLVECREETVSRFISKPHPDGLIYSNLVNAAVYILSPRIFSYIPAGQGSDFGKDIFPSIVNGGGILRAYRNAEYIKDLGTPDRLKKVEKDITDGRVAAWNLERKRAAIFIDRDGTINREVDNLRRIEDFEMLSGVTEAIKLINQSDFLAIVVTNQPAVAKGFLTLEDLDIVHKKLETELGQARAYINQIYFCPHHPDSGFEGEVKQLKVNCSCRKPGTGMIERAVDDYNIDLSQSYLIGDTTVDMQTAQNAGLGGVLVKTGYAGNDGRYASKGIRVEKDLLSAVKRILSLK